MSKKHLVIADTQVKPNHDLTYLSAIGQYIAHKKPDVIVHIGDHFDFESLSSYDKGKKSFEGRRVKEDLEAGHEGMRLLMQPIHQLQQNQRKAKKKVYSPRMVFCAGNHEQRADRFANDNPEFTGFIGTEQLGLEAYGWEVYPYLKPVEVDGINYVHYLANPFTGKPYGGSALNQLKSVGKSFVVGHKQLLDVAIRPTLDGEMQIGIINGACLTPDHKVLHSDLVYRPLGELKEGDTLVSFDEESGAEGKRSRRYKTGTVEKVKFAEEEVFAVTLKSGKVFKVTKDHKWLIRTGSQYLWKETQSLRSGTRVPKLLDEWVASDSYNAGWLSGIYDGEGCFYTRKTKAGHVVGQLGVTQKPGKVSDKIVKVLKEEVGVETTSFHTDRNGCDNYRIQGGLRNIVKVLGTLQPTRLMEKFKPELMGRITTTNDDLDTVMSIESIGVQTIVQTKIDAGTMVVEGYGHHNCYPHDEQYKGYQGNFHFRGLTMLHEVKDGFGLPSFVSLDFIMERYGKAN